jgi:hypothetical protein
VATREIVTVERVEGTMRVNRRFLYWGVFLVAIGGVLVATDLGGLDTGVIADGLRLWPLALVAIGAGIVLRRTRFSLSGGLLAAAAPGLVLGGGFAVLPRLPLDCGGSSTTAATSALQQGTFDGAAAISIAANCGTLVVTTAPGNGWQFVDGSNPGRAAVVTATPQSLSIEAGRRDGFRFNDTGHEDWQVALPTSALDNLSFTVNAGQGRIGLAGAQIGHLGVTANAAETSIDLSSAAALASLTGQINAGLLAFHLPSAIDTSGSLVVNAGELQVCFASDLGVRIHHTGALSALTVGGHAAAGSDWESPDYASATHHADLDVEVNLGAVAVNPIGGCK